MKFLTRNKIYIKVEPFRDAKKMYIICEGSRKEIDYFSFFRGFSSNIQIIPIPSENGLTDPVKLKELSERTFAGKNSYNSHIELSLEYKDEVWFVIDTDRWNEGNKIETLRTYVELKSSDYPYWFIAQSNPCFEIWQYYHVHKAKPNTAEVESYLTFKEFLNQRIKGGFDNRKMPLKIEFAMNNSLANFQSRGNQPDTYCTELHLLAERILHFIKPEIDKCLASVDSGSESGK